MNINDVKRIGHTNFLYESMFLISIILTKFCNYSCSYCWPAVHSSIKDFRPPDALIKAIAEVKRQAKENKTKGFRFWFAGGEPTLHPNFFEILDSLKSEELYQEIGMVSNMSQGMNWWQSFVDNTNSFHKVIISASWHREAGMKDIKSHREKFLSKVMFLNTNDINIGINLVMSPSAWDEMYEDAQYFYDHAIEVYMSLEENHDGSIKDYTPEQIDIMKEQLKYRKWMFPKSKRLEHPLSTKLAEPIEIEMFSGNKLRLDRTTKINANGLNMYAGWDCSAGFQSVKMMEPQGVIYRGASCKDKQIGTFESFQLFDSPRKCISKNCPCPLDQILPKSRLAPPPCQT